MSDVTPRRTRVVRAVAVWVVGAASALAACGASSDSGPVDYEVVDFETGADVSVDDLAGEPAVLTSWTTWCTECDEVLSGLAEFRASTGSDGIQVVAVNLDAAAVDDEIAAKFAAHDLSVPLWRDQRNEFKQVFAALGVPTTVVLDADGAVVATFPGAVDWSDPDVVAALDEAAGGGVS